MKLCLDIGNTRTKAGIYRGEALIEKAYFKELLLEDLKALQTNHSIEKTIFSTVGRMHQETYDYLTQDTNTVELDHTTPLPVYNLYGTPETLGKDRIAVVVGAHAAYPNENCLIVDAGSCITYDFLDKNGNYLGGNIAPGIYMRLKAMHEFTANLPLLERAVLEDPIGKSTASAMLNGAQFGILKELDGYIQWSRKKFGKIRIILTGGDKDFFVKHLKRRIFAHPNLVLEGLNKILEFNVE